ncbi:MAG TPA: hypothetical protein ENN80_08700, partial [Candidatus Hydrogenedentes bacterium]|nr:hypothetical protein [Candidatus Hydrogenedentota bacterium]
MTVWLLAGLLAAPNVVFLSVDTLRADHLGCYGYEAPTSPHIDQLATRARLYEDCVCEAPLTGPSFGSMLTGLYPRLTGTTRNGLRMPEHVRSVAQAFHEAGYQTFCVQSNWTLKTKIFAMDRGFDVYDDEFHEKRWGLIKPERYAEDVTDRAFEHLEALDGDRPFFAWIHYSDPHAPYRVHKEFRPSGRPRFWQANEKKVVRKYDSEVAYTDAHIGRLLERLPVEHTYILFVADHGESLYEHDYLGHGRRIYQTGVHVPLMLIGPGIAAGRTNAPARCVDVASTLLGMGGLEPWAGMLGIDLLHEEPPASRPRVIETYGGAVPKLPGARALMADQPPQRQGVLLEGWKLILDELDCPELFHIPDDPMEEK